MENHEKRATAESQAFMARLSHALQTVKRKKTGSHATPVGSDSGAMAIMKDYIRVTIQVLVVPHLACDLLFGISTITATQADL